MLRIIFLKNNMNIQILRVQIQYYYALIDHSVHNEEKNFSLLQFAVKMDTRNSILRYSRYTGSMKQY